MRVSPICLFLGLVMLGVAGQHWAFYVAAGYAFLSAVTNARHGR